MKTVPSENFGPRKHGLPPDLIVLHYTAMKTAEAAIERLCDPMCEVSAHFVISETGETTQLVDPAQRAWHAGAGRWGEVTDVNNHSIGIELANCASDGALPPYPAAQIHALEALLRDLMDRYTIPAHRIIGHSDCSVGRKIDPGPKFNWQGLALSGLSIWPNSTTSTDTGWLAFKNAAKIFGYRPPTDDHDGWASVLSTFRMRFRPLATGELDVADVATITDLAERFPCDPVDLGAPVA